MVEHGVNQINQVGYTAEVAIFTITSKKTVQKAPPKMMLQILLIKRKMKDLTGLPNTEGGKWALPGGFVKFGETAYEAARRELKQETGVSGFHIKHFNVYDQPNRDPRGWLVTNAFYAIANASLLQERKAQNLIAEVELFPIPEALELELAFDHRSIILDAVKVLTKEMMQTTIARLFLPTEFTLSELQRVLLTVQNHPKIRADSLFFAKAPRLPFIAKVLDENGQPKKTNRNSFRPSQLYQFTGEVETDCIYD